MILFYAVESMGISLAVSIIFVITILVLGLGESYTCLIISIGLPEVVIVTTP